MRVLPRRQLQRCAHRQRRYESHRDEHNPGAGKLRSHRKSAPLSPARCKSERREQRQQSEDRSSRRTPRDSLITSGSRCVPAQTRTLLCSCYCRETWGAEQCSDTGRSRDEHRRKHHAPAAAIRHGTNTKLPIALKMNIAANSPAATVGAYPMPVNRQPDGPEHRAGGGEQDFGYRDQPERSRPESFAQLETRHRRRAGRGQFRIACVLVRPRAHDAASSGTTMDAIGTPIAK